MDQQIKSLQDVISNLRVDQQRQEPSAWGVRMCTNCGRAGHDAAYCRQPGGGRGGRGYQQGYNQQPRVCYNCKQPGHIMMNCPHMPRQNHLMPNQMTSAPMNQSQVPMTQNNIVQPQMQQTTVPQSYPGLPQVNTSHHDEGQTTQDSN